MLLSEKEKLDPVEWFGDLEMKDQEVRGSVLDFLGVEVDLGKFSQGRGRSGKKLTTRKNQRRKR